MEPPDRKQLFAELDKLYLPVIHNQNIPHRRLLVLFSGPASSGKSTVARAIETEFAGLRLENDRVRTFLVRRYPAIDFDERNELTHAYREHIWNYLVERTPNGLWIIDSSADRQHEKYYYFARKHHFAVYLIAMVIPEATHREWIIRGGDREFGTLERYLRFMAQRREEQALFLEAKQPDLVLKPGYDIQTAFDGVAAAMAELGEKLAGSNDR